MSNENNAMKKKVTVVGAIALSAVLAGGIGYTSYNLLNDKANEKTSEEAKSSDMEETEAIQEKVNPLKVEDELDELAATAVEIEVPSRNLFDEKEAYSDLDNAIKTAEKYRVHNLAFFEDEEDEFKELNDSLVAVVAEEKRVLKENDVATKPAPLEPVAIVESVEATIQIDEPRKPVHSEDIVAIAKPGVQIVPSKPSQSVQPSEPIGKGPLIPTEPVEPVKSETPINPESVFPGKSGNPEPEEPEAPSNSGNPVVPEAEPDEQEIPLDLPIPEEPLESGNSKEPTNPDDAESPEETSTPTEPEIPSEPIENENPTDPEETMNPEIPQETIEPEVPTEPTIPEEPVNTDTPIELELPAEPIDPVGPDGPEENSSSETIISLADEKQ